MSQIQDNTNTPKPAYREPWFWMVMGPLLLVIIASVITVSIAVYYADDLVVERYEKDGKAIISDDNASAYARDNNLQANTAFNLSSGQVIVQLNQPRANEQLYLYLEHPAEADLDKQLILTALNQRTFQTIMPSALVGRWYVSVYATQSNEKSGDKISEQNNKEIWRVRGEIDFDRASSLVLK